MHIRLSMRPIFPLKVVNFYAKFYATEIKLNAWLIV